MEKRDNSAPGPNGYGAIFFKTYWDLLKEDLMKMFNDFWKGQLDIKRLNYG